MDVDSFVYFLVKFLDRLLKQNGNLPVRNSSEYLEVIEDALSLRLNVVVGCNTDVTPTSLWGNRQQQQHEGKRSEVFDSKHKTHIDVWMLGKRLSMS